MTVGQVHSVRPALIEPTPQGGLTEPLEWLSKNVEGFQALSIEERNAVMHFALLWSLFEDHALSNEASVPAIAAKARNWVAAKTIHLEDVEQSLGHFRARYFDGKRFTEHFDGPHGLRLKKNDQRQLVEAVIRAEENRVAECVIAVLFIIYRLRNNLLHGEKWKYGIRGQLANFTHANQVLMNILDATK